MKAEDVIISSPIHPDLFLPPHIFSILRSLFTLKEQLDYLQQEKLVDHLTTCHRCRTAVISFLSVAEEQADKDSVSGIAVHGLLRRFIRIHSALEAHEQEQLGAYAEAIVAHGHKAAEKSFPDLAAHVNVCVDCRLLLEDTVEFVREEEEMN